MSWKGRCVHCVLEWNSQKYSWWSQLPSLDPLTIMVFLPLIIIAATIIITIIITTIIFTFVLYEWNGRGQLCDYCSDRTRVASEICQLAIVMFVILIIIIVTTIMVLMMMIIIMIIIFMVNWGYSIIPSSVGLAMRIYLPMRSDADIRIIQHMSDIKRYMWRIFRIGLLSASAWPSLVGWSQTFINRCFWHIWPHFAENFQ